MIEPGVSKVCTYRPDGTQPRWLGTIGHVEGLTYSYINPGGPDQMTCNLQLPADYRTDALNPGRQLKIWRGGDIVWDGKLLEPTYTPGTGWVITGAGIGTAGADFRAVYTAAWGTDKNDAVNQAITRGLRWANPGITAAVWFGQQVDSGADSVADLLNLFCTKGGLTWYVTAGRYGNSLSVYAFPQLPTVAQANRILVAANPVSRTLGGDINAIYGRYQTSPDTLTAATFALTSVTQPASITAHGRVESYDDLSSSGQQTLAAIQAALQAVLNRYQRVSFAGPFTVHYGEFLNNGGAPVDLGTDQCGTIARLVLTDFGYGGEVVADPVVFMVGSYSWDDQGQVATIAPFQSLDLSMAGLLSELALTLPRMRPVNRQIHFRPPHWHRRPPPTSNWPGGRQPPVEHPHRRHRRRPPPPPPPYRIK